MRRPRLTPKIEKPFRTAVGHAIRNEIDEMEQGLLRLTDEQILFCLSMAVHVAGHVAIDACGNRWPDEVDLGQIAEAAAKTAHARALGLTKEDAYAYVKRVALRGELLDQVFSPPEHAANLAFFITGELLLAFHLDGEQWWDYLTRIEEAWEVAQELDLDLLPPLMLRAWRANAAKAKSQSEGTGAGSS